jgi:hypothetical protein
MGRDGAFWMGATHGSVQDSQSDYRLTVAQVVIEGHLTTAEA